jgi:hypothetical protein
VHVERHSGNLRRSDAVSDPLAPGHAPSGAGASPAGLRFAGTALGRGSNLPTSNAQRTVQPSSSCLICGQFLWDRSGETSRASDHDEATVAADGQEQVADIQGMGRNLRSDSVVIIVVGAFQSSLLAIVVGAVSVPFGIGVDAIWHRGVRGTNGYLFVGFKASQSRHDVRGSGQQRLGFELLGHPWPARYSRPPMQLELCWRAKLPEELLRHVP